MQNSKGKHNKSLINMYLKKKKKNKPLTKQISYFPINYKFH